MTIVYTEDLATADLSVFWKILMRWKGSMYQIIWPNMLLYVIGYFVLSLTYRLMMTDEQRYAFEIFAYYCRLNVEKIQVPFFLGFFVTQVYNRWWQQFFTLPWPDGTAVSLAGHMEDLTYSCRNMRRQVIRYACASFACLMRTMSQPVADRFKRRVKLVDHGFLSEDELMELRRLRLNDEYRPNWILLLQWSAIGAAQGREDDSMPSDEQLCQFLDVLSNYMDSLLVAFVYNWINLPISYTQLVTLVVYTYYLFQLVAQQHLLPRTDCVHQDEDYYFPLYLFTQFFFFMGWLKTAEVLINPFGEDDDDMDINWLIDRNFEMTAVADDHVLSKPEKRLFDWYWSQEFPNAPTPVDSQLETLLPSRAPSTASASSEFTIASENQNQNARASNASRDRASIGPPTEFIMRRRSSARQPEVESSPDDELELSDPDLPRFSAHDLKESSS